MNGQQIFELFLNGAYHEDSKLFHPSFRKGYRKITSGNVSLQAAKTKLQKANRLQHGMVGQFFQVSATKAA